MPSIITCPATCELCGNWLPEHGSSCPRNGVHPSQWDMCKEAIIPDEQHYDSTDFLFIEPEQDLISFPGNALTDI